MSLKIRKLIVGPIRTNCYIVNRSESKEAVIIDPGDEAFLIGLKLTEWNLEPKAVLLTHGHIDHIGAVNDLKKKYDIKVYAFEKEKEVITSYMNLSEMISGEKITVNPDVYVKDNEVINVCGIEFKVIYTPGHTVGSCCYYIEKDNVLFSGDTLFYHSHGRTDFPTGSQSMIIHSIVERLLVLKEDTLVYPGHEEETVISSEKMLYDIH